MTIPSVVPEITFTGTSGGTLGPFSLSVSGTPIRFDSNSHIIVKREAADGTITTLTEGTDYDLTGGPTAGSITLTSPQTGLLDTETLRVNRSQPITQDLDLSSGGNISSEALEAALDSLAQQQQETAGELGRTIRAPAGDTLDELPPLEASKFIFLDANKKPTFSAGSETSSAELAQAVSDAQSAANSAEADAESASGSKGAAAQSATDADAAKVAAEAARDAALANSAGHYADIAAGLAGTSSGEYFTVEDTTDNEIDFYLNNSGSEVLQFSYPTAAALTVIEQSVAPLLSGTATLGTLAGDDYELAILDEFGAIALGIEPSGGLRIPLLNGQNLDNLGSLSNFPAASVAGTVFSLLDGSDRAAIGVLDDGTLRVNRASIDFLNNTPIAEIISPTPPVAYRGRFIAEIDMVLSYGQSLSIGTIGSGVSVISTTQRFDNLSFSGGVRSQDGGGTPYASLIPLVETVSGDNLRGETPITGATDMVRELIAAEDMLLFTDHNYQLLASAPGAGGRPIAELSSGTLPFDRFVADVQAGYDLAQAAGKSFKVGGFFWTQGESDNAAVAGAYKTALVQLRNDLETEVQSITSQTEPLVCISYQTQSGNGFFDVAVEQLEAAQENANHYVACPLYWSDRDQHQTATGYKRLGAYYGLCYKRVVIDGEAWQPLEPVQIDRQGTVILIRFNVPEPPLVLDTSTLATEDDFGFTVSNAALSADYTISSVSLVGPDTIKIVTTAAPSAGDRVTYGRTNGGNLRDSQGDNIIFDGDGQNFPLHNWCVIFNEVMA